MNGNGEGRTGTALVLSLQEKRGTAATRNRSVPDVHLGYFIFYDLLFGLVVLLGWLVAAFGCAKHFKKSSSWVLVACVLPDKTFMFATADHYNTTASHILH
jgi:hypothetical protein